MRNERSLRGKQHRASMASGERLSRAYGCLVGAELSVFLWLLGFFLVMLLVSGCGLVESRRASQSDWQHENSRNVLWRWSLLETPTWKLLDLEFAWCDHWEDRERLARSVRGQQLAENLQQSPSLVGTCQSSVSAASVFPKAGK